METTAAQTPLTLTWNPPPINYCVDIGAGFVLELIAAITHETTLEGLALPENTAERWQLRHEDIPVGQWDVQGDSAANTVWNMAEPIIAQTITDPQERRSMELSYYRIFPALKNDAEAAIAEGIWETGGALDYICESCARTHVGDKTAIRAMILSYASTRVLNGEGVHISISGSAGTGKSHAAATAAKHLPSGAVLDARLSDKALYYHSVKPRTVLLMDDQELTQDMQELLKVASTDWTKPATYLTVNNQKPVELRLPEMCPIWVVKANLNGDEQILDRQLIIWTDESKEQLRSIQQAIFRAAADPDLQVGEGDQPICRAIWEYIPTATVRVPFAEDIQCDEHMDPRNIKILISLIQANALMAGPKREITSEPCGDVVTATVDDFKAACKIINPLLENTGGSQKLKLSSGAARILEFLSQEPTGIVPFENVRRLTGMNMKAVSTALHGRPDCQTDGLLSVCPALEIVDDSFVKESGGVVRRKAIQWSKESYRAWTEASGLFYMNIDDLPPRP